MTGPKRVKSVLVACWVVFCVSSSASAVEAVPEDHARQMAKGLNRAEVTAADREWWSFKPLAKATPPKMTDTKWVRNDLDRFVLAKLEEKRIRPNGGADKRQLLR